MKPIGVGARERQQRVDEPGSAVAFLRGIPAQFEVRKARFIAAFATMTTSKARADA